MQRQGQHRAPHPPTAPETHPSSSNPPNEPPASSSNHEHRVSVKNETPNPEPSTRPTKRSRKAINCEPCRASKLKCDRGRPCSGCVLRGTVASCYADGSRSEGGEAQSHGVDDTPHSKIDPRAEILRIRNSLATLETHFSRLTGTSFSAPPFNTARDQPSGSKASFTVAVPEEAPPQPDESGLYVGPTSSTALLRFQDEPEARELEVPDPMTGGAVQQNLDLLSELPEANLIEALVRFYFESSQWFYPHLYEPAFMASWSRFKQSTFTDHIVLATLFITLSIALHHLPSNHHLSSRFTESPIVVAQRYYDISCTALARYQNVRRVPTLELIELLLLRVHYLILKYDCEEIWTVRSEVISAATAMGLHRDPGNWKLPGAVVDRRRWAWWNIISIERWQSFLFGRPLAIANHHFDTQFPMEDVRDPAATAAANPLLPYLHMYRLAVTIGNMMDDILSIRPIPYDRVLEHDRALEAWHDSLPPDMLHNDYQLSRSLSPAATVSSSRLAVQSLCMRAQLFHVRLTLHRPFATPHANRDPATAKSFEVAVNSASRLIQMLSQARPEFFSNPRLATPGFINWGPMHAFAAAIFFSFQLVWQPDQPGAALFRADIQRVISMLEDSAGVPLANKAYKVLLALSPLYDPRADDRQRQECITAVRRLAHPALDSPASLNKSTMDPSPSSSISPAALPMTVPLPSTSNIPQHQPSNTYIDGQFYDTTPMPLNASEEALWSSSMGFDSNEWGRFMKEALRRRDHSDGRQPSSSGAVAT